MQKLVNGLARPDYAPMPSRTDPLPMPEQARLLKDTVNVGPGERYDVVWEALEPGEWLIHCHIPHHTTNDNAEQEGGGGLMAVIKVTE